MIEGMQCDLPWKSFREGYTKHFCLAPEDYALRSMPELLPGFLLSHRLHLGWRGTHGFMKSGPLEGPREAHGSVLLDGVGIGLFAFGAFPRLHRSIGPRIHALSPG